MTGPQILIIAILIVFMIAFVITMLALDNITRKIVDSNLKLAEKETLLQEQNKLKENELKIWQEEMENLSKQIKHNTSSKVVQLHQQVRQDRINAGLTAQMTDEQLFAWVDEQMQEQLLFTKSGLTLKTMANALGLTQKRLSGLFKDQEGYARLGDYINEKRILYACSLLCEHLNWTIEAVGTEAGFGSRRTFQVEMKRRLGITPQQYRQSQEHAAAPTHK